jgi:hypothetical protein
VGNAVGREIVGLGVGLVGGREVCSFKMSLLRTFEAGSFERRFLLMCLLSLIRSSSRSDRFSSPRLVSATE